MSASKKAAKKPAAKTAVKPVAPKKALPKAKSAVVAKKAATAGAVKKPVAKAKKTDKTKAQQSAAAPKQKQAAKPAAKAAKPAPVKAKAAPKAKQPAPVKTKSAGQAVAKPQPKAQVKKPAAKAAVDKKSAAKAPTGKKSAAKEKPSPRAQAPKAPSSGTKRATAPAALRSPAQAGTASKKARPTFVKQSSSSKQDNSQTSPELDAKTKELVLSARKRTANGPSALRPNRSGKGAIAFTMDDVAQVLAKKQSESSKDAAATEKAATAKVVKKQEVDIDVPQEKRVHSAVSLSDILGFNPAEKKSPALAVTSKGREVPRKWSRYFKLLVELREQVSNVLEQHTAETLKRSNRDDSGDLSGYGQHMADAGTDTFDRDFALSMVSSEQEALFEINEAIERIYNGSYGVCEITGETISAERLEAVPFTRYSLEGQKELEKNKRQKIQRGGVFTDNEDNISFDDDDN